MANFNTGSVVHQQVRGGNPMQFYPQQQIYEPENQSDEGQCASDDQELQWLLKQALQARQQERDYQSLCDQIRCLKQRQGLQNDEEEAEKANYKNSCLQAQQELESLQIQLAQFQEETHQEKARYDQMRHAYIQLNKEEADLQNQMSVLRQNTGNTINQNKNLSAQINTARIEKHGLSTQIADVNAEITRIQGLRDKLKDRYRQIKSEQQHIQGMSHSGQQDINRLYEEIETVDNETKKRLALLDSTNRSFTELMAVLDDIKGHNQRLEIEYNDGNRKMAQLQREIQTLSELVSKEKSALEQMEESYRETQEAVQSKEREIESEKGSEGMIIKHQQDLKDRLRELNDEASSLRTEQDQLNRKLAEFAEENERIRHELFNRGLQATQKRQENQKVVLTQTSIYNNTMQRVNADQMISPPVHRRESQERSQNNQQPNSNYQNLVLENDYLRGRSNSPLRFDSKATGFSNQRQPNFEQQDKFESFGRY